MEAGDYYRLLADGYYQISAKADGFHPSFRCVHIVNNINVGESGSKLSPAPELNFALVPNSQPELDHSQELETCQALWEEVQAKVSDI